MISALGKGYDLRIYDRNVNSATFGCANRDFILNRIQQISRSWRNNVKPMLDHAQTVVIGDPDFWIVLSQLRNGQSHS